MLETVNLSAPACPLRIEYSKAAMEQIRRRARAGLMAAPRVGMAVGGLLLGVREDSRIRILDSVDLPCSHSTGPSFTLTNEEKRESREMVAEANTLSTTSKVTVVGWYCSKTRGDAVLSDSDRSFFADLFPGPGQIALVLRPDLFESMRAVFHFRDERGTVVRGLECEVDEWIPSDPAAAEQLAETDLEFAEAPAAPPESPKVIEIRQSAPKPIEPAPAPEPAPLKHAVAAASGETRLEDIISLSEDAAPAEPAPAFRSPLFGQPEFPPPPPKRASKWPLIFAAAGVLLVLLLAAYFTRDSWLPKPPLSLTFSEDNGTLLIHWDPDAVRGVDHASMYVNDGGQAKPAVIALDQLALNLGQFSYTPKSKRVTAKLDTGRTSAFSSWIEPETPKKADTGAPASDNATPAAATTPPAPDAKK